MVNFQPQYEVGDILTGGDELIKLVIWDLGDTLNTTPPGGQDAKPLDEYPEIQLRQGAKDVLCTLRDCGYRQAVLSNTAVSDSEVTRRMLANLGIEDFFDYVFATASELDEAKPGKPDAVVYNWVLDEMQVSPHEAVMVGNTWDTDILGANRSGIHALWLQNPEVMVRRDSHSPINSPPWVIPIWDISDVPIGLSTLQSTCSGRRT